jgi:hypothetical protein
MPYQVSTLLTPLDLSVARISYLVSEDDEDTATKEETQLARVEPAAVFQTLANYGSKTFQDRQGFVAVLQNEEHAVLNAEWADICS